MTTGTALVAGAFVLLGLLLAFSLARAAGKPTPPRPAPRPYGPPLFPPDLMCACGCPADKHLVVWEKNTFIGTRCPVAAHGGHKLKFASNA